MHLASWDTYDDVLRLAAQGIPARKISGICKISRDTVDHMLNGSWLEKRERYERRNTPLNERTPPPREKPQPPQFADNLTTSFRFKPNGILWEELQGAK